MRAFIKVACFVFLTALIFCFSSCTGGDNTPVTGAPPAQSPDTEPLSGMPYIPDAQKINIPALSANAYTPYFAAWIDDHRILICASHESQTKMFVHNLRTEITSEALDGADDFGWFGRVLSDGRICMYGFEKIVILNKNTYQADLVVTFPDDHSIGEMDVSPDGTMIAYTSPQDFGLYVANIDLSEPRLVQKATASARGGDIDIRPSLPRWSTDSRRVFFMMPGADSTELKAASVDIEGKQHDQLDYLPVNYTVSELSSGKLIAVNLASNRPYSVESGGHEMVPLLPEREYLLTVWDQDAKYALALWNDPAETSDVFSVYDIASGKETRSYKLPEFARLYFSQNAVSPNRTQLVLVFIDELNRGNCYLLKLP